MLYYHLSEKLKILENSNEALISLILKIQLQEHNLMKALNVLYQNFLREKNLQHVNFEQKRGLKTLIAKRGSFSIYRYYEVCQGK